MAYIPRAVERINLGLLDRGELADLIQGIEGERPSASLLLLVAERSQGNPLVAEEVLIARREEGGAPIAGTLAESILTRLRRRSPACRRALRLLAAADGSLTQTELAAVDAAAEPGAERQTAGAPTRARRGDRADRTARTRSGTGRWSRRGDRIRVGRRADSGGRGAGAGVSPRAHRSCGRGRHAAAPVPPASRGRGDRIPGCPGGRGTPVARGTRRRPGTGRSTRGCDRRRGCRRVPGRTRPARTVARAGRTRGHDRRPRDRGHGHGGAAGAAGSRGRGCVRFGSAAPCRGVCRSGDRPPR